MIYDDNEIANAIGQNRYPTAGAMIEFRKMRALESIVAKLATIEEYLIHPLRLGEPGLAADEPPPLVDGPVDIGPALQHRRNRRGPSVEAP